MKYANTCFRWNIVAFMTRTGERVELVEFYGDIYALRDVLAKHNLRISDTTLYGLKKIKDREYFIEPLKAVDIAPSYQEILGIDGQNVAYWHIQIGRRRNTV